MKLTKTEEKVLSILNDNPFYSWDGKRIFDAVHSLEKKGLVTIRWEDVRVYSLKNKMKMMTDYSISASLK